MPSNTMNFSACALEVLLLTRVVVDWFCIMINFVILTIVRLILRQAQDAVPFMVSLAPSMVSLSNHHDEVCVHLHP